MITFDIIDRSGIKRSVEVPEDINLSLMEVLKASEYPVLATCGGMALCATCHVSVQDAHQPLREATEAELDMLDTLPNACSNSRLACQIKVDEKLNGAVFQLMDETEVL